MSGGGDNWFIRPHDSGVPMVTPGRRLDFVVKHEDWSEYELLDYPIRVMARTVALHLFEMIVPKLPPGMGTPPPNANVGVMGHTLVSVYADPKLQGPPTPTLDPRALTEGGELVRWKPLREPENVYLILGKPERIITTRLIVTSLRYHAKMFGTDREPLVVVDSQPVQSRTREARVEELTF